MIELQDGAVVARHGDPEYRQAEHFRVEALVEAVLQPTVPLTEVAA